MAASDWSGDRRLDRNPRCYGRVGFFILFLGGRFQAVTAFKNGSFEEDTIGIQAGFPDDFGVWRGDEVTFVDREGFELRMAIAQFDSLRRWPIRLTFTLARHGLRHVSSGGTS